MTTDFGLVDQLVSRLLSGHRLPPISGGDGTATPTPTPTDPPPPDLGVLVDAAVKKYGDHTSALKAFASDLYSARDDLKTAKAQLPPAGSVVLKGDDIKAWEAYQSFGKPADVRKALEEGTTFKTEAEGYRRKDHHAEVAEVAGFKPAVLDRLASQDKLTLVLKDAKDKAGKDVKVAHVQGEGDKTTPLAEYAEKHWGEFLPALKAGVTTKERPPGTPLRTDSARGSGTTTAGAEALRRSPRYARM